MKKSATILPGVWLVVLLFGSVAEGQVSPQSLEIIRSRLHQAKIFFDKMPETRRQVLSGAAQNLIHLANVSEHGRPGEIFDRPAPLRKASEAPQRREV